MIAIKMTHNFFSQTKKKKRKENCSLQNETDFKREVLHSSLVSDQSLLVGLSVSERHKEVPEQRF